MAKDFSLLPALRDAGYHIEPAISCQQTTVVVEVPIDAGADLRTVSEVSMWEQLSLAGIKQNKRLQSNVTVT